MVRFRCQPANQHGSSYGTPERAQACRCVRHRIVEDDLCLMCGRFLPEVISTTWSTQAQVLAQIGLAA